MKTNKNMSKNLIINTIITEVKFLIKLIFCPKHTAWKYLFPQHLILIIVNNTNKLFCTLYVNEITFTEILSNNFNKEKSYFQLIALIFQNLIWITYNLLFVGF
jgi:hypothetical protein